MNYIRLNACDLDSKFGFEDGDVLENHGFDVGHDMLIKLVRHYLLPAIGRDVKILTFSSCHNPIRLDEDEELTDEERDVFFDVSYEQIQEVIGLPDKITSCNAEYIRADIVEEREKRLMSTAYTAGRTDEYYKQVDLHEDDYDSMYSIAGLDRLNG